MTDVFDGKTRSKWSTIFRPRLRALLTPHEDQVLTGELCESELPLPPTYEELEADELLKHHFDMAFPAAKHNNEQFSKAQASGMVKLQKALSNSLFDQYISGKINPGDFKEAWRLLDAEFTQSNSDQIRQSMDYSDLFKNLHSVVKIEGNFLSFWNTFINMYRQMNLQSDGSIANDVDDEGKGTGDMIILNMIFLAVNRSGNKWLAILSDWEKSTSSRSLRSLLKYFKRLDSSIDEPFSKVSGAKRGSGDISSDTSSVKILKLQQQLLDKISVLSLQQSGRPSKKPKPNPTTDRNSNKFKSSDGPRNQHPDFSGTKYKSALKCCWNCGANHATAKCTAATCLYCTQVGNSVASGDKHTWWFCPKRKSDKEKNVYSFLPPASCRE